MDRFRIMEADCKYKETDRCLKEHFRNGLNNDIIIVKIVTGLMVINDTSSVTSR